MPQKTNEPLGLNSTILQEEVGDTGLLRVGPYVYEEWHRDLRGRNGAAIYREMMDNDPIVGAFASYVDLLTRQMPWEVKPADESERAQEIADQLKNNMGTMSQTWGDFISEAGSLLFFGYSVHEMVFRKAENGGLEWDKFPIRAQETNNGWQFDEHGNVTHFIQQTYTGKVAHIPLEKCLHFTHRNRKNNPEGYSALRNAYTSYMALKNLQWIEGVGFERSVAGMPIALVPPEMLAANADPNDQAIARGIYGIVRSLKRNQKEGVVFPSDTDAEGNPTGYKLTFAEVKGSANQQALNQAIIRYEQRLATSLLSEFMMLGMNGSGGSYNMHDDKTNHFVMALEAMADNLESTINRQAVSKLMELNGIPKELWPRIKHGQIKQRSLKELSEFVNSFVQSGVLTPDEKLEAFVRETGDLPLSDVSKEVI